MSMFNPSTWKRCQMTPRDHRNQQRFLIWFFAWILSWVGANISIKEGWAAAGVPAVVVAILPTLLGIAMILAYWKFIREADELQRKIQLEGLAVGFGFGIVAALTIHALGRAGVLTAFDLGDITALMMFGYAIAVAIGARRYA